MFYVYVHRRADTGAPFYVGKGSGRRARVEQNRNPFWRAVVAKAGGYEVAFAATGLDEELAHLAEMELIAKMRTCGHRLTNMTDGGEGLSGYVWDRERALKRAASRKGVKRPDLSAFLKGLPKSAEHRKNLSEARKGLRISAEGRAKLSAARKGKPSTFLGKTHRPESKAKTAAALLGAKNHFYGKTHTAAAIEKIRVANVGRKDSDRTRARKSAARMGRLNPLYGVPVNPVRKERQRASLIATIAASKAPCAHCGRLFDKVNLRRWHGDRCKEKN